MKQICTWFKAMLTIFLLTGTVASGDWSKEPSAPIAVCDAEGQQRHPKLIQVEDGFIVSWDDRRRGSCGYNCVYTDVYAQKLSMAGEMLWQENGRVVAAGPENALLYPSQISIDIVHDGRGGALAAWNDQLGVTVQGYITRLTSTGVVAWGSPGKTIQDEDTAVSMPTAAGFSDRWGYAADSENGVFVSLPKDRQIGRFDSEGRLRTIWFEDRDLQYQVVLVPMIEPNGQDSVSAIWINGNGYFVDSILARKLVDSEALWPTSPDTFRDIWGQKSLFDKPDTFSAWRLTATSDGAGGIIAVWVDNRSGSYRIYAQRIDAEGNFPWGTEGIEVSGSITSASHWAFNLALTADDDGGAVIAWNEPWDSPQVVKAQHLNSHGAPLWNNNGVVVATGAVAYSPYLSEVVYTADDNVIVLYHIENDISARLIGQKLSAATGEPLWEDGQIAYEGCFSTYYERARMVSDGLGGAVIAFAACDGNIYAHRLEANFTPVKPPQLEIRGNGADEVVTIEQEVPLTVTVRLSPFDSAGTEADWWVVAQTPSGWYGYQYQTGYWVYAGTSYTALTPTYQGALLELPTTTVLNITGLPPGLYMLYFGVDSNLNGVPDLDLMQLDSLAITVSD